MKKIFFALAALTCGLFLTSSYSVENSSASSSETEGIELTQQQKKLALYGIAFYNLENLFDTVHAVGKNDYEFLPDGSYAWGGLKYHAKLKNMSTVLSMLCTDKIKAGASVIGISEIENRDVVEDLLRQPALCDRGYKILHYDTDDRRGVDCAMLYNPRFFELEDSLYIPYIYPSEEDPTDDLGFKIEDGKVTPRPLFGDLTHITRGFLCGIGRIAGERLCVIVNHWPSRGAESPARERAGYQVRKIVDALYAQYNGDIKFIVMGDLNDDPDNLSMTKSLGCKFEAKKLDGPTDFFNPWYYTLRKQGQGTLLYNNKWNLFDQIVVSANAVDPTYNLKKAPEVKNIDLSKGLTFYQHVIFMRDFLFQQEGKYKGNPLRTHAGGSWMNGYSDHLPTQVYLIKEF